MHQENRLAVITTANGAFLPHAAVLISSVLQTKHPDTRIDFFILDDGISLPHKDTLNHMVADEQATLSYLQVDADYYHSFVSNERFPDAVYHRISIPDLLEELDYDRALYLDSDMIVREDLRELWNTPLEGNIVGAVEDVGFHPRFQQMGVQTRNGKYFNSGMLLFDLNRWREEAIGEKVFAFIAKNAEKLHFYDQDALNAVLHDRWLPLHPRYNAQTGLLTKENIHPDPEGEKRHEEARNRPAVVHFNGVHKPDHPECEHPYVHHYREIRERSPFPMAQSFKISSLK
ncbi:glycosyltransferase family 8 protein [Atopococcus tabaci]|uniref:glycosyltransferase family 8 protein n=1 Tax=Atopococcus tabaci TaxID=269774 RepID=UPI000400A68E|nr:glycosyltransferase family 8 protein [Atopococcus tabaci]